MGKHDSLCLCRLILMYLDYLAPHLYLSCQSFWATFSLSYAHYHNSIEGMNWVKQQVTQTGRPSVISMSLSGGFSQAQNDTVGSVRVFY